VFIILIPVETSIDCSAVASTAFQRLTNSSNFTLLKPGRLSAFHAAATEQAGRAIALQPSAAHRCHCSDRVAAASLMRCCPITHSENDTFATLLKQNSNHRWDRLLFCTSEMPLRRTGGFLVSDERVVPAHLLLSLSTGHSRRRAINCSAQLGSTLIEVREAVTPAELRAAGYLRAYSFLQLPIRSAVNFLHGYARQLCTEHLTAPRTTVLLDKAAAAAAAAAAADTM